MRWSREEPRVGSVSAGCWSLRALGLNLRNTWRPQPVSLEPGPLYTTIPFHLWGRAHWEDGVSPAGAGVRTFPRGLGRRLFLLQQKVVLFLISFAQSLQRGFLARKRPRRAAPGLSRAAVRADCVSQKRVPRAQRRAGPESGRVADRLRGQLGRGGDKLGRALLATPCSPGRLGAEAGGVGGGGPGPEGPARDSARNSTRPVRPSTG